MAKNTVAPVVKLNAVQLEAYNRLMASMNGKAYVHTDIVDSEFKANVINGLYTAGVIKDYRNTRHVMPTGVQVELLVRKSRTPKADAESAPHKSRRTKQTEDASAA
jgi:hypothetical protein